MGALAASAPDTPRAVSGEGRSGLLPVIAISASLAIGLTMAAMAAFMLAFPAQALQGLPTQHQDAENATFLFALVVALPLGIAGGRRLSDRLAEGPGPAALTWTAILTVASLALCVLALRIVDAVSAGNTLAVQLPLMVAWCVALGACGWRLGARRGAPRRFGQAPTPALAAAAAGLAAAVGVLAVVDLGELALLPLLGAVIAVAAVDRLAPASRGIAPRWGRILDLAVVALLFLAIPNLRIFDPADPLLSAVMHFHQDLFLGPAERVIAGDPVLANNFSQYGVGSIDLIAGWFALVPENNYTLGLLEGLLSAAMFACAYVAIRIAGVARALAALTMLVGVIACVFALRYPLGGLLQHGAIRFGLPVGIVLGAAWGSARPARASTALALQLAVLAISAIWALEAFAYTLLTMLAVSAAEAALLPPKGRLRWAGRRVGAIAGAVVLAHVVFALIMLAATGDLPQWGTYLRTLKAFLVGKIGDITYDFEAFSPAFAVGALYLVSVVSLVALLARGARQSRAAPVKLIVLAGTTAWGIALYSYFVNRSAGHILPYVSLPALITVALWLSLIADAEPDGRSALRRLTGAGAGALAALVFAAAYSSAGHGLSASALGLAAPGGESLGAALDRTWDPPPISPGADQGAQLLERYLPGEEHPLVLASADPGVEVLARTGRANLLPLGDPWEESFVPSLYVNDIRDAVANLEPGQRALIDAEGLKVFAAYRRDPASDPLADPVEQPSLVPTGLARLQELALKLIAERFELRSVKRSPSGFEIVELDPKR
jgi:hypothetical protein